MWKNEREFSKFILNKLKSNSFEPTRLESAMTESGIPDIYVMGNHDYFIELKNMPTRSIDDAHWKVMWRPGQQAFAAKYRAQHTIVSKRSHTRIKCTWTIVGLKDGVLAIRMLNVFDKKIVHRSDPNVFIFEKEQFTSINLNMFLRAQSNVMIHKLGFEETWHGLITATMKHVLEDGEMGDYHDDIDYPTADELSYELKDYLPTSIDEVVDMKYVNDEELMLWIIRLITEQAINVYVTYINSIKGIIS